MNRKFIYLIVVLSFMQTSCSINWTIHKADDAKNNLIYGNYSNYSKAIRLYKKAFKRNDENPFVSFKIAECYRLINDTLNMQQWYLKSIEIIKHQYRADRGKVYKLQLIKYHSLSYYYLNDYKQTITTIDRLIRLKFLDFMLIDCYIDCLTKLGRENEIPLFYERIMEIIKDKNKSYE